MQGEGRDAAEVVELAGGFREAVERTVRAALREEKALGWERSQDGGGEAGIWDLMDPVIFHGRCRPFYKPSLGVDELCAERGDLPAALAAGDEELHDDTEGIPDRLGGLPDRHQLRGREDSAFLA